MILIFGGACSLSCVCSSWGLLLRFELSMTHVMIFVYLFCSSAFDLGNGGGDDDDDNGGSGEKGSKKNARAPSQKRSSGEVDGEEAVAIASALVNELSQACGPLLAAKTPPAAQAALDRAGAGVRYSACVSGGGGLLASASVWNKERERYIEHIILIILLVSLLHISLCTPLSSNSSLPSSPIPFSCRSGATLRSVCARSSPKWASAVAWCVARSTAWKSPSSRTCPKPSWMCWSRTRSSRPRCWP